jgi:coproporphyrinogen III oxidase
VKKKDLITRDEMKKQFDQHVRGLQNLITSALQNIDPNIQLQEDVWERSDFYGQPGGGGITRAFQGDIIENAGVNTSLIFGAVDPTFAKTLTAQPLTSSVVWACGISLIIHPRNPRIPTTHANFRFIEAGEGDAYWFGGGADLTPYYPHEEDFRFFHQVWADACRPYGCYTSMKEECDRYFTNTHRHQEMRGIGGIFFDHFHTQNLEKDLAQVRHLSEHFIPSYFPLVEKRKGETWNSDDEDFMLHRRGRYVEFNLIHDRGTLFGLKTNGRTDSILISLPARCKFTYRYTPPANSVHEKMLSYYYPYSWAHE